MSADQRAAPPRDDDLPDFLRADTPAEEILPTPHGARRADVPAEPGVWVFILGDLTLFGVIFVVFAVQQRGDHAAFAAAAGELLTPLGATNTLVLLTSSYVVVHALHAARRGSLSTATRLVDVARVAGAVFIAIKAAEYAHAIAGGHSPREEAFFLYYYVLTGLHLLHVVLGTIFLTAWRRGLRQGRWRPVLSEGIAVYWHMVDLLWVIIFALLYLEVAP